MVAQKINVSPDTSQSRREFYRQNRLKSYKEKNGKEKSLLGYYTTKYRNDLFAMDILKDKTISISEKLNKIKTYNYQKKIEEVFKHI